MNLVRYNNMKTFKQLISDLLEWIKYQYHLLPHRPRLIWHKLWIRKDEFHHSLDMDVRAMLVMNDMDKNKYLNDLMRRRNIAHKRDLGE